MFRTIRLSRRSLHDVPVLKNHDVFCKSGIKGLYSPEQYQTIWGDYQKFLTLQLTMLTNGTENELRTPYQILLKTAKQTTQQHVFHYASQAHNNHFVMEQFTHKEAAQKTKPSRLLLEKLSTLDIPDIATLRERMLLLADSSFGQGWVFLVENGNKDLQIMRCNNDGTPYYYGKNQVLDMNGGVDEGSFEYLNQVKALGTSKTKDWTLPILGINCWDVAFMKDYGVNGKADYLVNVWDCINWDVVNKRVFQV